MSNKGGGVWSDNELAELQPRRNPPPLFSPPQGISVVRPLVPEVSLFIPSAQRVLNDENDSGVVVSRHLPRPSTPPPRDPSPSSSADVMDILRLQSDQLMKLQNQVQRLLSIQAEKELEASSQTSPLRNPEHKGTAEDYSLPSSPQKQSHEEEEFHNNCSPRNLSDNFTQTSAPPSPKRCQAETNTTLCLPGDEEVLRLIDKPASTESRLSICSNVGDFLQDSRTQSILLGESASTFGKRDSSGGESFSEEQFERILCQVQRLLSPAPDSPPPRDHTPTAEVLAEKDENNCTLMKTVDRVKSMGASFLHPSDFLSSRERSPIDTFYEPKAEDSCSRPTASASSTDASLIINTAAMKYLNDEQLSSLAAVAASTPPREERLNRPFGLPESHLSLSTRRFLRQHQLFDEPS